MCWLAVKHCRTNPRQPWVRKGDKVQNPADPWHRQTLQKPSSRIVIALVIVYVQSQLSSSLGHNIFEHASEYRQKTDRATKSDAGQAGLENGGRYNRVYSWSWSRSSLGWHSRPHKRQTNSHRKHRLSLTQPPTFFRHQISWFGHSSLRSSWKRKNYAC